jgi:predicted regulator of Ras-like GTPase activity (Roadblock/LC7/MglB family)
MSDLGFLLDDFRKRVPNVLHILAMSADGLLIVADQHLDRDAAERLAATSAALLSLLRGAGQELDAGGLSHNLAEYDGGFLFAMSTDSLGVCLLMLADRDADLGQVSYELTALVNRVGDGLTPAARTF